MHRLYANAPFYVKDLGSHRFQYPWQTLEQIPYVYQEAILVHTLSLLPREYLGINQQDLEPCSELVKGT